MATANILNQAVLGQAWDSFDGYLFDIDGTLINCTDATHYFAFCAALKELSGQDLTLNGVVAHGNTDVGILRDALRLAGTEEATWRAGLERACRSMGDYVEQRRDDLRATVLPSVVETLEHLRARGAMLGTATGNLERIGRAKLEHADLMRFFPIGGWSDGLENRADVFRRAAARMRERLPQGASLCVVGDTPVDVSAARDNGLPVIAVATGIFSVEELRSTSPDLCLHSLAELELR